MTAVSGATFTLKTPLSPTGSSKVHVGSTTVITEQATGTRADLKKGVCATAIGAKNAKGVIAAMRVMLSAPIKGQRGFGLGRGTRPNGSRPGTTTPRRPPNGRGGGLEPISVGGV